MSEEKLEFKINKEGIKNKKIALVRAMFNTDITSDMLKQAEEVLKEHEVEYKVFEVPGSYEIPYTIKKIHQDFDGLVAIGCLIKGETMHFEYICEPLSHYLMKLSIDLEKPVGFGISTCTTYDQADRRRHIGAQATKTVLQLISA